MSARSTFSQTPAYSTHATNAKEIAAEEALVYEELKRTILLLETIVKTNAKEKCARVLRNTSKLRKTLSVEQLQRAVRQVLPDTNTSKTTLLATLDAIAIQVKSTVIDTEMKDAVETTPTTPEQPIVATVLPVVDVVEVEIYFFLYVLAAQLKYKLHSPAFETVQFALARCGQVNRRTLDSFQAKLFVYYVTIHEIIKKNEELPSLRQELLAAHRTACLRYDEIGQATLINLLLRKYLQEHLYEQAFKFLSKTTFPETISNNQLVRYLYYVGKIQAIQLEYTEAYTKLMQSIRKAPQNTAIGFRRTVYKLAIIVQLLMGEVPERNVFNQEELSKALGPYLQLTNAVRIGNLEDFNHVLHQHTALFQADQTYTLILRLRHNVIKTGLRKISTSYSRITFQDICQKLALESAENAEFVCAKAIRDGVMEAVMDHENGWLQSKETVNVYTTKDPQMAFQKRIAFCLDVHNEAVKGMSYPPDAYKKDLESAEERLEREKQEEELAKEIGDEMDEGL